MSLSRSRSEYSKTDPVILNDASTVRGESDGYCEQCRCHDSMKHAETARTPPAYVLEVEEELNERLNKLLTDYETAKELVLHQSEEALRKAHFEIDNHQHDSRNRLECDYEHKKQDLNHRARQHIWMLECHERKAAADTIAMKHAHRPLLNQIVTSIPSRSDFQLYTVHWPDEDKKLAPAKHMISPPTKSYTPVFNGQFDFPLIYKKPYLSDDKLENSPP